MTMNTQQTGGTDMNHIPLGAKLQSAREAQRLDRKDAAAQLRLSENVIDMIENNSFPDTMPPIFVRGYTRAYGKFLQMPEDVILAGLEPIKPKQSTMEAQLTMPVTQTEPRRNSSKYLMKGLTAAVILTLISLLASWWQSRATSPTSDNLTVSTPLETTSVAETNETPLAPGAEATHTPLVPAGISIQQPLQNLTASPAPAYTPGSSVAMPTPSEAAANVPSVPKAAIDESIPAYKRVTMAPEPAHRTVTASNLDDE